MKTSTSRSLPSAKGKSMSPELGFLLVLATIWLALGLGALVERRYPKRLPPPEWQAVRRQADPSWEASEGRVRFS